MMDKDAYILKTTVVILLMI